MENKKTKWLPLMTLSFLVIVALILLYPKLKSNPDENFFGLREVNFQVEILDQSDEIFNSIKEETAIISQDRIQEGTITDKARDDISTMVTLSGTANYRGPFMTLGGQTLKVGKDFFIKTEMIELKGRIIGLEYGGKND